MAIPYYKAGYILWLAYTLWYCMHIIRDWDNYRHYTVWVIIIIIIIYTFTQWNSLINWIITAEQNESELTDGEQKLDPYGPECDVTLFYQSKTNNTHYNTTSWTYHHEHVLLLLVY